MGSSFRQVPIAGATTVSPASAPTDSLRCIERCDCAPGKPCQAALTQALRAPISRALQGSNTFMANTKSAKKAARQTARRTVINRARRSRLRSAVRKVEEAIAAGDRSRAVAAMAEAEPVLIRAAQKNIVHRNAARRKVSRLAHRIAELGKT